MLFLPKWYNKGIVFVKDLLHIYRNFLSLNNLTRISGLVDINFLDYYKMKILINKFLVQNKLNLANLQYIYQDPILPNHVKILFKSKTGSRDMYEILNTQKVEPKMKRKWDNDLNLNIDSITLKNIFFKLYFCNHLLL